MENKPKGNGLISPEKINEPKPKKNVKTIKRGQDGLMEREEVNIITEDGKKLLI